MIGGRRNDREELYWTARTLDTVLRKLQRSVPTFQRIFENGSTQQCNRETTRIQSQQQKDVRSLASKDLYFLLLLTLRQLEVKTSYLCFKETDICNGLEGTQSTDQLRMMNE